VAVTWFKYNIDYIVIHYLITDTSALNRGNHRLPVIFKNFSCAVHMYNGNTVENSNLITSANAAALVSKK
jgi:hypothetical protein